MYVAVVGLTTVVGPLASIFIEHALRPETPLILLIGRWFVFWSAGVRLVLAGFRQIIEPAFTARQIFHMSGDEALPVVRELGFANLAAGIVGLLSLGAPSFVPPVAISAALFYGAAGVQHVTRSSRSTRETIALVSDLFIFAVLFIYVVARAFVAI